MKKVGFYFLIGAFPILFLFTPSKGAEESCHPDLVLIDYDGNEISLESNTPYSPKNTCGECHEYDDITNAYHFQMGRTDAEGTLTVRDDMDSKNPWLLSKGMYGKW